MSQQITPPRLSEISDLLRQCRELRAKAEEVARAAQDSARQAKAVAHALDATERRIRNALPVLMQLPRRPSA